MLAAYSGTRRDTTRRNALVAAISFLVGSSLALIALGFVAGFAGQAAQKMLGRYWKLFAGVIAVLLGLAALKLLPVRLPGIDYRTKLSAGAHGLLDSVVAGILLGGGVAACSLPCNPGIFIVLGAAVLQGHALWGMGLMAAFAVGFSLPMSGVLFGVALGRLAIQTQKMEIVFRYVAGALLVGAGFYLLATF